MASVELQALIERLRERGVTQGADLQERRASYDALGASLPQPEGVRREPAQVDGVPGMWFIPEAAESGRAVLYLHGGAYVLGSFTTNLGLIAHLARAAGAWTLAIDYRLAPEHALPASVEDATTAYRWLLARGLRPEQLAIAGDSAGGGLTAATLLALRDAGEPLRAAAVLISPWLDLTCSGGSMRTKAAGEVILSRDALLACAALYLRGTEAQAPLASPLFADLTGLPPLLIQVGTEEILLDDAVRFAERARAAGVQVTLDVWEEMIHVWQFFAGVLPEGRAALERAGAFIRQRTAALRV